MFRMNRLSFINCSLSLSTKLYVQLNKHKYERVLAEKRKTISTYSRFEISIIIVTCGIFTLQKRAITQK